MRLVQASQKKYVGELLALYLVFDVIMTCFFMFTERSRGFAQKQQKNQLLHNRDPVNAATEVSIEALNRSEAEDAALLF